MLDISDEEKWCICFDGSDVAASNIIQAYSTIYIDLSYMMYIDSG